MTKNLVGTDSLNLFSETIQANTIRRTFQDFYQATTCYYNLIEIAINYLSRLQYYYIIIYLSRILVKLVYCK